MYAAAVPALEACPFCKELFPEGEQTECPHCNIKLLPAGKALSTVDAGDGDEDEEDQEPQLPWGHWGHARGPLLVVSLLGLGFFFLPWVSVYTPDRAVYTGLEIAQRTQMGWAAAVAWFTLLPVVLSRRTVPRLRGARLAAALLTLVPAAVALLLLLNPPTTMQARGLSVRIRFDWGIGLYLTLALGLLSTPFAFLRLGKE